MGHAMKSGDLHLDAMHPHKEVYGQRKSGRKARDEQPRGDILVGVNPHMEVSGQRRAKKEVASDPKPSSSRREMTLASESSKAFDKDALLKSLDAMDPHKEVYGQRKSGRPARDDHFRDDILAGV